MLYRSLDAYGGDPCVLVIGNFDGVHRGHQALIEAGRHAANERNVPLGVLCFDPHPRHFFNPDTPLAVLTPMPVKYRLLQTAGADFVIVAPFANIATLTPQQFVADILIKCLRVVHIVVGENFRFGAGRTGDVAALTQAAGHVSVHSVALLHNHDGTPCSSSQIRADLQAGDPRSAASALGHSWTISGTVVAGDRRGRSIGFPTANLNPDYGPADGLVVPRYGVYAVHAVIDPDGTRYEGVANWGIRPTFVIPEPRYEVHFIDYQGEDLYDRRLDVALIDFLRPEQRFASLEALKSQIALDCNQARDRLRAARSS